jgi:hypothetical protein
MRKLVVERSFNPRHVDICEAIEDDVRRKEPVKAGHLYTEAEIDTAARDILKTRGAQLRKEAEESLGNITLFGIVKKMWGTKKDIEEYQSILHFHILTKTL